MHFGLFVEELRQGVTQPTAFRDVFGLAEKAEAWGMDCVWLGEIHFTPGRSVISASLQVATAIATRTRRVHVGTAVQVLPLNHPLRIAEEVATVDQLSEGRFEFGIGRSGVVRSLRHLRRPVRGEPGALPRGAGDHPPRVDGRAVQLRGRVLPRRGDHGGAAPLPGAASPRSAWRRRATRRTRSPGGSGLPIFVGLRATEISDVKRALGPFRDAWREAGHTGAPSVYLRIPVYVSPTEDGAREEPRESLHAFFGRQTNLARSAVGRAGAGPADRRSAQAERMAGLTYDDMLARKVAFGTPAQVIERLGQVRDELGLDGFVVEVNPGGLIPQELETRSLHLLTHEVIPHMR